MASANYDRQPTSVSDTKTIVMEEKSSITLGGLVQLLAVTVVCCVALTTAFTFVVVKGETDNLFDRLQTESLREQLQVALSANAQGTAPAAVSTPSPAAAPTAAVMAPTQAAKPPPSENPCHAKKPYHSNAAGDDNYFKNVDCLVDGVFQSLEQSGTNVTKGYKGDLDTTVPVLRTPIETTYKEAGLCPVNVHWHLGTEHLSVGEYDENGKGPSAGGAYRKMLASSSVRKGFQCLKYDAKDSKFTTEFAWKHCVDMHVGETYEVHWPHSAAGECLLSGRISEWQYQTPFYDGVFCNGGVITLDPLNTFQKIGVQAQVFTIVNDEDYYYPDLFKGMLVDKERQQGTDMAKYTGSTTGTSRSNTVCSRYTPITWQVDRKCHLVSASSFDKMCADMKMQADDMSDDLHAHGSRELVADEFAADNHRAKKML